MDKSWQGWVNENIARGCDVLEMGQILQKNKFTLPQIRKMMGRSFPEVMEHQQEDSSAPPSATSAESSPIAAKCISLLEIQRDLARLSPRATTIERRSGVSADEFLDKYYAANRPVILCDLMTYWQAPQKWTPVYFKENYGEEIVEIQALRESSPRFEIEDAPHRKNVRFSDFIDMVTSGRETNDYYLTARNGFFKRPALRPLLSDIEIFSEYLKDEGDEGVFMWIGPKGTVTPLHHDAMNILLAQVSGRKQLKLIPANEIELVYNHFAVYSDIDPEKPDYDRFPKYRYANVIDVVVEPGEVLFLPVGWWHWVKALDVSITVTFNNFLFPNNFKWEDPKGTAPQSLRY